MALVESFSGIRGIYRKELTPEIARRYALSFLEFLKENNKDGIKIVVGMDTRGSGTEIFRSIAEVIDGKIVNVGILPTPAIENAVREFGAHGGIIITASHNQPEYNGFKFLDNDGAVLRPKDIEKVIKKTKEIQGTQLETSSVVNMEKQALQSYLRELKKITGEIKSKTKFLVDPNGGAGTVSKEIFEDFGIRAAYINMIPGKFNRIIEPNNYSLVYLKKELEKLGADFAVGFDCDADRAEILLNDGNLVSGNHILALITQEMLTEKEELRDKKIVVNDATSYVVKEIAEKNKAKFIEVEVGEINVVDEMLRANAIIAGEGSNGGIIIPPFRCRDGILTVLLLLKLIGNRKKNLKELIEELPEYYNIKEKIKIKQDFSEIRDKIKEHYIKKGFEIKETGDRTGGLKARKEDSWVWLRQSKTEDKTLRIITDSKNKRNSEELLEEARSLVKLC